MVNDGFFDYTPIAINRTQPKVNQDEPGSSVVVSMATNYPEAQTFTRAWVARAPSTGDTRVTIQRVHQGDGEFQPFWIGYLVSAAYEQNGELLSIQCKSLDNLFTLEGPRKNWGTLCNHQLYGPECRLNELNFVQNGTVTALAADGVTYTLSGIGAPTVRHLGGELRKPGTLAQGMIVAVSGSDFTIQYPVPDIGVGDTIQVVEGCDHTLTDCAAFPNGSESSGTNVENFGGTPYTPPLNLFTKGVDAI